jgi:hypothetical protein
MKARIQSYLPAIVFASALASAMLCSGQGTFTIGFEGPPSLAPGTGVYVQQYFEAGMWFRPLGIVGPGNGFDRQRGGGGVSFAPDNGTAYLSAASGDSLVFSFEDGSLFGVFSVDLAEYSTLFQYPVTIPFIGYRPDGTTVSTSFTTDGIIDGDGPLADFQTFYFGPEFSGLTRVEIPTYGWSLDNLSVFIPEPSPSALLLAGAFSFCLFRMARHKRASGR